MGLGMRNTSIFYGYTGILIKYLKNTMKNIKINKFQVRNTGINIGLPVFSSNTGIFQCVIINSIKNINKTCINDVKNRYTDIFCPKNRYFSIKYLKIKNILN